MAMQSGFIKRIRDIMRMDAGINGDAQRIEQMVWMLFLKVYDAKEDDWELNEDNYTSIIPDECRWRNWAQADDNGHAMTGDKLLNFVNNTLFPTLKELPVTPDTPVKKAIVKSTFEDANNYMKDGVYLRQVIDIIDEIEFDDVKESHAFGFVYEEILRDLQAAGSSGEFYTPRAVTDFMALMIQPKLGEKMADFACGTGGFITSWLGQLQKQVKDTAAQKQFDDSIYGIEKKPFPYLLCVTNMLLHDIEVPNIYHMNSLKHNLLDYTDDDKYDVILMNPPYGGHEDKSIQSFFPEDLASSETADLFMSVIMYRLKKNGRAAVVVPNGFLSGTDNAKVAIKTKLLTDFNLHTIIRLPESVFSPYTSIATNLMFFDNSKPTEETWFYRLDIPSDRKHFSKTKPMELKHFNDCIIWWNDRKPIDLEDGPKAKKYTRDYLINEQGCNIDLCGYPQEEIEVLSPVDTVQIFKETVNSLVSNINQSTSSIMEMLVGECNSKANHSLSKACNKLVGLAGEFPERLKASILQYAIQGKLVEQRPEEGTAEELYELIQEEKQKLIKAGKLKKEKPFEEISAEEIPFDIPESWKWVRIGDIYAITMGQSPDGKSVSKDIDGMEFHQGKIFFGEDYLKESDQKTNEPTKIADPLSVLLCVRAPVGIVNITERQICIGRGLCALKPLAGMSEKYALYSLRYLKSDFVKKATGTTFVAITGDVVKNQLIPLPPIKEQQRIVAKIEEILPYCNQEG